MWWWKKEKGEKGVRANLEFHMCFLISNGLNKNISNNKIKKFGQKIKLYCHIAILMFLLKKFNGNTILCNKIFF